MVLSLKLAEEVPWYNFLWEKGSKDSFMFFTFSCKYKFRFFFFFFFFFFFGGGGGGLVLWVILSCVLKKKTSFGCILTRMLVQNSTISSKGPSYQK